MLTHAAFDPAAATYDDAFTRTPIAQLMRRAVWARVDANFRAGMRVLELGCGTGEDALYLAQRGIRVTATDASAAMLAITRQKAERAGVSDRIETTVVDMNDPTSNFQLPNSSKVFDGIFSNFGALNCVANLQSLIFDFSHWTKPNARLILVVMGPFCPWEIAWHLAHLQPRQAFRRMKRGGTEVNVGGAPTRVWYPSPHRFVNLCAPHFKHIRTSGLGVFVPPPYAQKDEGGTPSDAGRTGMKDEKQHPLLTAADNLERRIDSFWPFNQCGDHYILELERRQLPLTNY